MHIDKNHAEVSNRAAEPRSSQISYVRIHDYYIIIRSTKSVSGSYKRYYLQSEDHFSDDRGTYGLNDVILYI